MTHPPHRDGATQRIDELDWLRGLMALSILAYHTALSVNTGWSVDASGLLGRLGIYGVSVFFVLSGLSMAHVYGHMRGLRATGQFYLRRLFRIWPLLTLVVALEALRAWATGTTHSPVLLLMNATGIFGFVSPSSYINVGAWSIGNEMVYYSLTPLLFLAYHISRIAGNVTVLATAGLASLFAFGLLDPSLTLTEQWKTYIHPANNLLLYSAGVAIYFNFRDIRLNSVWRVFAFWLPILVFVGLPFRGETTVIVTGLGRVIFVALAMLIVFGFYKAPLRLPRFLHAGLDRIGIVSYGIYLLHPFVLSAARRLPIPLAEYSPWLFLLFVAVTTFLVANIVYVGLERPFVRLGKRLTSPRREQTAIPDDPTHGPTQRGFTGSTREL